MKKDCLPPDHPNFAVIFENLAHSYSCLGRHLLALKYSLRALRLRKRIQKSNHPDRVESLKVLAHINSIMGSLHRTMHYLQRARKVLKRTVSDYRSPMQRRVLATSSFLSPRVCSNGRSARGKYSRDPSFSHLSK